MQTKETTLDKIRSRPRFKLVTSTPPSLYIEQVREHLARHSGDFVGNINREMATIRVKTENEDYWKPQLELRIEQGAGETIIRGVFGPSPSVWTFFMFLYFGFSILAMLFACIFFIERQIGSTEFPWAGSVALLSVLMLGLTYLAARIGQAKAQPEMQQLRALAVEIAEKLKG